jgi:hypothetical protein
MLRSETGEKTVGIPVAADVEEQRLGALESAFDHESSREGERPV